MKVFGIIAILAMIGVFVGCSVDPDEQTVIKITGIPSGFNNYFAFAGVTDQGISSLPTKITGGEVSVRLLDADTLDPVIAKNGRVSLVITTKQDLSGSNIYSGTTGSPVTLGKGEFSVAASEFFPDISDYEPSGTDMGEIPDSDFFGTYKATYGASNITETIIFSTTSFKISDDTGTGSDHLYFTIQYWDEATTPSSYSTEYPKALYFKGVITEASPINAATNTTPKNLYGNQTGPNLDASDIGTTVVKMFIYYNDSGSKVKFIRTAFVPVTASNPDVIMTTTGGSTVRLFTQQ